MDERKGKELQENCQAEKEICSQTLSPKKGGQEKDDSVMVKSIPTPLIFQNPFMAPNNFNEIHFNSFQTNTTSVAGVASICSNHLHMQMLQEKFIFPPTGFLGNITFNKKGQIIGTRTSQNLLQQQLDTTIFLIDPNTLKTLATQALPSIPNPNNSVTFAGGYFFLSNRERVVCVTGSQQIRTYQVRKNQFHLIKQYDLTNTINNSEDSLNSVLPDAVGNLWWVSKFAVVGYINSQKQLISLQLTDLEGVNPNETITKSFATDEFGGVFVVTDYALYRLTANHQQNKVQVSWRNTYDRGTRTKPGQIQQGSGTTPTLFNDFQGNHFVAIADNADPFFHILVWDRNTGQRIVKKAVFLKLPFRNCTENSLVAVNHSIIVENNYGNRTLASTLGQRTTRPGLERIDFDPNQKTKKSIWVNYKISIPSVVTQMSTKDGLLYTYAKDKKGWYFAAVSYWNGKIQNKVRIPKSSQFFGSVLANNFYAGIAIGPEGTVYVGVTGGLLAWIVKNE